MKFFIDAVSVDFIRCSPSAEKPKHLKSGSVGSDIFSTQKYTLLLNQSVLVECKLKMKIPIGYCGLISGRSGLALKGVNTHVGIIDNDYEGLVGVVLTNIACYPHYVINIRDRIGQITLVKFSRVIWNEVENVLGKSDVSSNRTGGFGSTGI